MTVNQQNINSGIIYPDWSAPTNIKSLFTTRQGGFSEPPFDRFNLAQHVEDNPENVKKNRKKLRNMLPSEPIWLNQVHSNLVVDAAEVTTGIDADGSFTNRPDVVSVVMTADCLPVLMCNRQGTAVAALHAGWRGLLDGILEQGVKRLLESSQCMPEDILTWFGPAIGPKAFEVGDEVRQAFLDKAAQDHQASFQKIDQSFIASPQNQHNREKKWFADIYQLAQVRLSTIGVENFSGGNYCTYNDKERFYSYRRDGKTGRMASLIWIEAE